MYIRTFIRNLQVYQDYMLQLMLFSVLVHHLLEVIIAVVACSTSLEQFHIPTRQQGHSVLW